MIVIIIIIKKDQTTQHKKKKDKSNYTLHPHKSHDIMTKQCYLTISFMNIHAKLHPL